MNILYVAIDLLPRVCGAKLIAYMYNFITRDIIETEPYDLWLFLFLAFQTGKFLCLRSSSIVCRLRAGITRIVVFLAV